MRRLTLATILLSLACGGDKKPSAADAAAKKAADKKAAEEAELEKRKKAREEAEAEEAAQKAAYDEKLDKLAVLPAEVPDKLEPACKAMLDAYDRYMQKVLEGDMLTKWKTGGNEMQLAVFRKECIKRTPRIAACQANALSAMGPDMKDNLADVMGKCAQKFADEAKAP